MGTSSTFSFDLGFLSIEATFDSSYGVYREYTDIPKVWTGLDENGETLVVFEVSELIKYWDKNEPSYYALRELHTLLKSRPVEDINCYPYEWNGYPKGMSGKGRVLLSYGL